jgi:hypothetical protein
LWTHRTIERAGVDQCSVIFLTPQGHCSAVDSRGPTFQSKLVLEGNAGEIVSASFSRANGEM